MENIEKQQENDGVVTMSEQELSYVVGGGSLSRSIGAYQGLRDAGCGRIFSARQAPGIGKAVTTISTDGLDVTRGTVRACARRYMKDTKQSGSSMNINEWYQAEKSKQGNYV